MYEIYCKLRDSKGRKDSDVAKATGITKSTFSDWKNGRSSPKQDKLQKIADYFGVSLDYLLGRTDEKESTTKTENTTELLEEEFPEGVQVLRRATKELTPEARNTMLRLMKAFLDEEK